MTLCFLAVISLVWTRPRAGALAGACVYTFSAVLGARLDAGHYNYILCQAWLPWAAAWEGG